MADDDRDDDQTDEDSTDLVPRAHIRQLEEKARRAGELETRLAQLERENAFAKALGSAATDPKMAYFVKGYEGDLEVEAIRSAALRDGFLSPPPDEGVQRQADMAAHDRITGASSGAGEPRPTDPHELIRAAQSEEEVLRILESLPPGTGPQTTRQLQ